MNSQHASVMLFVTIGVGLILMGLPIIGTQLGKMSNNFFNEIHECRPAN